MSRDAWNSEDTCSVVGEMQDDPRSSILHSPRTLAHDEYEHRRGPDQGDCEGRTWHTLSEARALIDARKMRGDVP
jgi:hypothetical protein